MEQTFNANLAQCLQNANHWGVTKVYNVCNGTVHDVPWGAVDYIGVSSLICIGAAFIFLIAGAGVMIARSY